MNERNISFPECYNYCAIVKVLGVSECENIPGCRWKFKEYKEAYRKWAIDEIHEAVKVDE